jgi:hypothetical protein
LENRKSKIENRKEKTELGAVDGRASWGAAVLRPYTDEAIAAILTLKRLSFTLSGRGSGPNRRNG